MKAGGTVIATYTYDALDRRIGFKDNGTQTWTVYDGKNPYADFNGSGTLLDRYVYRNAVDELLARTDSGGTTSWYLTDKLGTVRDVVGGSGTVLDHVIYDSYGNVTSETNATNGERFKYTGREYDATTGIYYYRARYYDSVTGRFLRQDPTGFWAGDTNLYRYVHNRTTLANDPTGLEEAGSPAQKENQEPRSPPAFSQSFRIKRDTRQPKCQESGSTSIEEEAALIPTTSIFETPTGRGREFNPIGRR